MSGLQAQAQLCFSLQPGHYSSLPAPNLQHTANQERHDHCGKQHHSRELLMELNMFRALLCPSSGALDYNVDYHIGRFVLGLL